MESAKGFAELVLGAGFHDWENGDMPADAIALIESRDAAIRAECADRAVKWVKDHADTDWVRSEFDPQSLRAAIMGEDV